MVLRRSGAKRAKCVLFSSDLENPTPCSIHPTPYTLHPTLYTLHPTPYTLHPTPCTLHPTPFTLHLTPHLLQVVLRRSGAKRAKCVLFTSDLEKQAISTQMADAAVMQVQIAFSHSLGLHRSSPESGDLQCKPGISETTVCSH